MSASQLVTSHLVLPIRPCTECEPKPKLPPCTVKLADPVPPAFTRRIELTPLDPNDIPLLTLPDLAPRVRATKTLPPRSWLDRHRAEVSDSQALRSQDVRPTRALKLLPQDPALDPYSVKLADPVPTSLARIIELGEKAKYE